MWYLNGEWVGLYISTHAPAGGATVVSYKTDSYSLISTHAPAGGATSARNRPGLPCPSFLLTPLREGRLVKACIDYTKEQFLLTPLREGRPAPGGKE